MITITTHSRTATLRLVRSGSSDHITIDPPCPVSDCSPGIEGSNAVVSLRLSSSFKDSDFDETRKVHVTVAVNIAGSGLASVALSRFSNVT